MVNPVKQTIYNPTILNHTIDWWLVESWCEGSKGLKHETFLWDGLWCLPIWLIMVDLWKFGKTIAVFHMDPFWYTSCIFIFWFSKAKCKTSKCFPGRRKIPQKGHDPGTNGTNPSAGPSAGMSSLTNLHMQWLRGLKMTPSISIRICPILGRALPLSETWIHKLPNWIELVELGYTMGCAEDDQQVSTSFNTLGYCSSFALTHDRFEGSIL